MTAAILTKLPWRSIGLALAVLALVLGIERYGYTKGRHSRDAEVAALSGTIANMKAASAKAAADNIAHVQAVETRDEQIRQEQTNALSIQITDARAAAARYAGLHHPAADQGHAGNGALPQAADTAGAVAGAGAEAVVPAADLDICAENTAKAQGWLEWWAKVSVGGR